jgi:hypothetical protein
MNALPTITVTTPATCSPDLLTYSVGVTVSSGILTGNFGTVTPAGGNVWNITGVIASSNLILTLTDGNGCVNSLTVNAPGCTCPVVTAPVSGGNKSYCAGSSIPTLTATVLAGETVDWYSASSGGTALASGSTSYTPAAAGTFYAEARNTTTNCKSSTRTGITVSVNPLPAASAGSSTSICQGSSAPIGATAVVGSTYSWTSNPSGFTSTAANPTVSPSVTTIYTVTETVTATGCSKSNSVTITVNPLPAAVAGTSTSICSGSGVTLGATAVTGSTYSWTSNPSGFTSTMANPTVAPLVTTTYTVMETITATGCSKSNSVTITVNSCFKTLNLTSIFLQGLYNGSGTMRQAWDGSGPHWPAGVADHITVELHSSTNYSTIIYSATNVPLSTTGAAVVSVPATYNASYYITVKHRNSIETTSASAISFAGNTINQSFGSKSFVYGGNLGVSFDGIYMIYSGDVNSDGIVDTGDMNDVDNGSTAILIGYTAADANGDGIVDTSDMNIVDNNSTAIVMVRLPH